MRWGEKAIFAIEASFTESHGRWRFGHFIFWVGDEVFGDLSDSMNHAFGAAGGRTFLANSSRRSRPDLDGLSPAGCFLELFEKHVSGVSHGEPWDRDPYLLDEIGEASVRDRASLVALRRSNGTDRVIARRWADGHIREVELKAGLLDSIVEQYCAWAEGL